MKAADFDYTLPLELIAQTPCERGQSKLLAVDRTSGNITLCNFSDFIDFLQPDDTVILNDTRVIARRVSATRESGAKAEVVLLSHHGDRCWEALVRPGARIRLGAVLALETCDSRTVLGRVLSTTEYGGRVIEFESRAVRDELGRAGTTPLPPYIHEALANEERYQTVYSSEEGSAAAPTAGLHFSHEMLDAVRSKGCQVAFITLHVGIDTFRPVKVEDTDDHIMHGERFYISELTAKSINTSTGRIIAIGTTTVRALESAALAPKRVQSGEGFTRLFITPGYEFKIIDALLTNFHLPKSTLLMMISAFASASIIRNAYQVAVDAKMKFYSFGDAMFII